MSDSIIRTYPHKLAAKQALASAGYKKAKDSRERAWQEYWKKQNSQLELFQHDDNQKWGIRSA